MTGPTDAESGPEARDVTELLGRHVPSPLFESLRPALYYELKRLASHWMARERPDHTLQTTALLNEAIIRLSASRNLKVDPAQRASFFAAASTTMRHVLIDHARARAAEQRGGGQHAGPLNEGCAVCMPMGRARQPTPVDIVALDDMLSELERRHLRAARVVELRVFGGLTIPEVAAELGVDPRTINGDWSFACAWLSVRIRGR